MHDPHLDRPLEAVVSEELVKGGLLEEVRPPEAGGGPQRGRLGLARLSHLVQDSGHVLAWKYDKIRNILMAIIRVSVPTCCTSLAKLPGHETRRTWF